MRSESLFVAERPAAVHAAELLGNLADKRDVTEGLQQFAQRLARHLGLCLAPFCGAETPGITLRPIRTATAAEHRAALPALTAHCVLVTGTPDSPLMVTLDGAAILRMIDRTFGGRGEAPAPLPETLPPSAMLLIGRLAGLLADRISLAIGSEGAVLARNNGTDLDELFPFAPAADIVIAEFTIAEGMRAPWLCQLALPAALAVSLAAATDAKPRKARASYAPRMPDEEPFGSILVPLSATIVDARLPLSTVAGLAPGVILPVAVARQVPLRIGSRTIAMGTVGSQDDRVALQISTVS